MQSGEEGRPRRPWWWAGGDVELEGCRRRSGPLWHGSGWSPWPTTGDARAVWEAADTVSPRPDPAILA